MAKDLLMSIISLISLTMAMFVLVASPGPGVFAIIARSIASGFRPAFAMIIGIIAGDIIFLMFAIFGLSLVAQAMGKLFLIIKICGGAYLLWIGLKIWFLKPLKAESKLVYEKQSYFGNIIGGLLITLSNPKVILFYCGFLPTFINLSNLKVIDVTLVVCIVVVVLTIVLTMYAYLASHARQFFSNRLTIKKLNRLAGGVMMITGVIIITKT